MESAAGRVIGDKPFSRDALYLMLRNHTYCGEIVHEGQSHPGEHPPIIDQPLWDAVQMRLAGNIAERSSASRTHQPSLLAGMLLVPGAWPYLPCGFQEVRTALEGEGFETLVPVRDNIFSRSPRNLARRPGPVSQSRILTIDKGRFTVRPARLASAMISTPGHRASKMRQRGACQPGREMLSPRRAPIERCSGSQHAHAYDDEDCREDRPQHLVRHPRTQMAAEEDAGQRANDERTQ